MTAEEAPHINAIRRSVAAGFQFLHLREAESGVVTAIHAQRLRSDVIETYTFRHMHEGVAARFRAADYPRSDPLWQRHGTVEAVITALLELPPHGALGAPTTARSASSALWLPGNPAA